jgi:hypothetical protein
MHSVSGTLQIHTFCPRCRAGGRSTPYCVLVDQPVTLRCCCLRFSWPRTQRSAMHGWAILAVLSHASAAALLCVITFNVATERWARTQTHVYPSPSTRVLVLGPDDWEVLAQCHGGQYPVLYLMAWSSGRLLHEVEDKFPSALHFLQGLDSASGRSYLHLVGVVARLFAQHNAPQHRRIVTVLSRVRRVAIQRNTNRVCTQVVPVPPTRLLFRAMVH